LSRSSTQYGGSECESVYGLHDGDVYGRGLELGKEISLDVSIRLDRCRVVRINAMIHHHRPTDVETEDEEADDLLSLSRDSTWSDDILMID
jgi:hypothetical protein